MKKKKGFALIYTVLISTLVLISIVGLTIKIVPEKAITNSRTYSQRALLTAEAGTSQVLFDLRNFGTNPDYRNTFDPNSNVVVHYLTEDDVKTLLNASNETVFSYQEKEFDSTPGYKTTYQAKIKVISNDTTNKVLNVDLYVLGNVEDISESKIFAKTAIKTNFYINYKVETYTEQIEHKEWVPAEEAAIFNYAIFSGTHVGFGNPNDSSNDNSKVTGEMGNIHSEGSLYMGKNKQRVSGVAEYVGSVSGGGTAGKGIKKVASIPFPSLNIDDYKTLADAFRLGIAPYDGSKSNFPNTSDPIVLAVVQSYLGEPGTSSTLTGIQNFYNDLKGKTGAFTSLTDAQWQNLLDNAKNIVYYVHEEEIHINSDFLCIGTLVIDGNLTINGNAKVGDELCNSAILVKGDITRGNGNGNLYGLFYADGTGSVYFSGNFTCIGSIATRGSVTLGGNCEIVTNNPIINSNLGIGRTGEWRTTYTSGATYTYYSVDSVVGSDPSNPNAQYLWQQISFDEFDNVQ